MAERDVEKYLREQVEARGAMCEKHVSPGRNNVPDRICSWRFGFTDWVETKAPGEKPNGGQARDHKRRRALGHSVWVCDTEEKVDIYMKFCSDRDERAMRGMRVG